MNILLIFLCNFVLNLAGLAQVPQVVNSVDLNKYDGEWYEIAKYSNWFQRNCAGTKAEYTLLKNGKLAVLNKCQLKNNLIKLQIAKGEARVIDAKTNAKLKVNFSPIPFGLFEGDYWILHVDEEYQIALVGTPDRKYFWILSRSPSITETTYRELLRIAEEKGFSPQKIRKTPKWKFGL